MITENDITFENDVVDGRYVWQDVIANGKVIAALAHKQGSLFKPMTMWIQKCIPESEAQKVPNHYPAEDEGMIFGRWDFDTEFNSFLNYINGLEVTK